MTVVLGAFLEVNTWRSARGLGQLSDISDTDRKKLRSFLHSRVSLRHKKACNGGAPEPAAVWKRVLQAFPHHLWVFRVG